MPPRTRPNNQALANAIRDRRAQMGLTIEEAAAKAQVGSKTWSRYEAGGSIRQDKARGLCRALGWAKLPETGGGPDLEELEWTLGVDPSHEAWSPALEERCGPTAAAVFAIGSDILNDEISECLTDLAALPPGAHVGQASVIMLEGELPDQFVPRYDYEFVYTLRAALRGLRRRFAAGSLVAHSVLEEVALYMVFRRAEMFADLDPGAFEPADDWAEWLGDILGDLDVEFYLFAADAYVTPRMAYHFDHWLEQQFYSQGGLADSEIVASALRALHAGAGER